jgi:N-acyl-D-amino-acid deacylase
VTLAGVANADPDSIAAQLLHPAAIISNSDAGAHVQTLCAYGDTTLVLSKFVRECADRSSGRRLRLPGSRPGHRGGVG